MKIKLAILTFILINFILTANTPSNSDLSCEADPKFKYFDISTNLHENSDDYNVTILKNCEIEDRWKVKQDNSRMCVIPERVYEGEDNIRRSFRFTYHENPSYKDKIEITNIKVEYPRDVADVTLTKNAISLYPGESYDIYIDYDCWNMQEGKRASSNWFKLKLIFNFGNGKAKEFEYYKICDASYADRFDFSHVIIIAVVFVVVYAAVKEVLKSKLEGIIVERYTEIKNPENLLIIAFVIGLVLIFLNVINYYHSWAYFASIIVAPFCIAMIIEAVFKIYNVLTHLETKSIEIPMLSSITYLFLASLGVGIFIVFLWTATKNFFLNDLISIAISLITIRVFKFTSFKFILAIYIIVFVYDYIWIKYSSSYYGENYKLTNHLSGLPVKIQCPELRSSPFNACNSLPIADIILPGLLLTYSKKFDESKFMNNNYFLAGIVGLGAGLIINILVYYNLNLPTPSFFYTGPIILVLTLIYAYYRQELYEYIEGFSSTAYENKLERNIELFADRARHSGSFGGYQAPPKMTMEMDNLSK
jgi:hypothetical protein